MTDCKTDVIVPRRADIHHGGVGKRRGRGWVTYVLLLVVVTAAVSWVLPRYVFATYTVPSSSMEPTIVPGDRLVVIQPFMNGVLGRDGAVGVGDVVVFIDVDGWMGSGDPQHIVKRVIGIGGDVVEGRDGKLFVNGSTVPLDEPYVVGTQSAQAFTVTVPDGRLFVLGDNRDFSLDSRSHIANPWQGTISEGSVRGKVSAVMRGFSWRSL